MTYKVLPTCVEQGFRLELSYWICYYKNKLLNLSLFYIISQVSGRMSAYAGICLAGVDAMGRRLMALFDRMEVAECQK